MKTLLAWLALVAVGALAAGCSDAPSTPTSPSADRGSLALTAGQLAGTWTLSSMLPAGQAEQARPSGATYTLTFMDGRLSTRADCNTCSSSFALSGNTLDTASAMACTRAACPTMAFENTYTSILSGSSTIVIVDGTLVLSSDRGVLRFTR